MDRRHFLMNSAAALSTASALSSAGPSDAISLATPNHQHAMQTIWACPAGKDVYVEKPCSHNMFEAKQVVAAARKYDRIVQQGSQSRSNLALMEAVQKTKDGLIGNVYHARGLCYKWCNTIGKATEEAVLAGVDCDLWLGPAPKRPSRKIASTTTGTDIGTTAMAISATRVSTKST